MVAVKRKQSARRLKIDKLRGEGLTHVQIAKRLKVSVKTIKRDVAILNEEIQCEPAYTEERLRLRAKFNQRFQEGLQRVVLDWMEAKKGSTVIERTTRPFKFEVKAGQPSFDFLNVLKGILGEEKAREMLNEYGLMVVETRQECLRGSGGEAAENPGPAELLEKLQYVEITEKTLGPDWKSIASLHRVMLDYIVHWSKIFGLTIERETRVTAMEERTVTGGRVVLPEKVSIEEWEALVQGLREGRRPGVLPEEDLEAATAQGVKLMEWNPEKGAFVPVKAKGK